MFCMDGVHRRYTFHGGEYASAPPPLSWRKITAGGGGARLRLFSALPLLGRLFLTLPLPEELLLDFDDDGDESDDESDDDSDSDDAGLLLPLPLPEGLLLPLPLPEGLLLPLPLPLLAELFFVFPSPAATPPLDEPAGHASLLKPAAARAPVNPRYLFKT
jgi:hypothetical protein